MSWISVTDFLVALCSCAEIVIPSALPFGGGSADSGCMRLYLICSSSELAGQGASVSGACLKWRTAYQSHTGFREVFQMYYLDLDITG